MAHILYYVQIGMEHLLPKIVFRAILSLSLVVQLQPFYAYGQGDISRRVFSTDVYEMSAAEAQQLSEDYSSSDRPWDQSLPTALAMDLGEELYPHEQFSRETGVDAVTYRIFFAIARVEKIFKSYHAMLLLVKNGFEGPVETELNTFISQLIHFNTEIHDRQKKSADVDVQQVFETVFSELFQMSELMSENLNLVQRQRMERFSQRLLIRVARNDFKTEISKANADDVANDGVVMWPTVIIAISLGIFGAASSGSGAASFWASLDANWPGWLEGVTGMGAVMIGAAISASLGGIPTFAVLERLRRPHRYKVESMKEAFSRCAHVLGGE